MNETFNWMGFGLGLSWATAFLAFIGVVVSACCWPYADSVDESDNFRDATVTLAVVLALSIGAIVGFTQ